MSFTQATVLAVNPFSFPRGQDMTQYNQWVRGTLSMNAATAEYVLGGIGSNSFEVTDVTALGVATFNDLVGLTLYNNQTVIITGTSTAGNSGVKTISNLAFSSATAGTFQLSSFGAVHDATQTADGVGQVQFGVSTTQAQTFTVTATVSAAPYVTYTYTTLTGPQLQPGQSVTIIGETNPGNNGTFKVFSVTPTAITAGAFVAFNSNGVSSDTGTGTGSLLVGAQFIETTQPPTQVRVWSTKGLGYVYEWNPAAQTIQCFVTGTASTDPLNEAATGAHIVFDTLQFEAVFPRAATV